MSDFFKDFNKNGLKISNKNFFTNKRTVCIKYKDGKVIEHFDIEDPWRYIVAVKKNINVVSAWIKDE